MPFDIKRADVAAAQSNGSPAPPHQHPIPHGPFPIRPIPPSRIPSHPIPSHSTTPSNRIRAAALGCDRASMINRATQDEQKLLHARDLFRVRFF